MKISAPLFNKILETNHLIKGRLNVKNSELKKLFIALQKDDERLRNKQSRQEKIIQDQINKCNALKVKRKHNFETLQKSFYPTTNKISLLYKNQKGAHYIKARFYWECKQREVQVGSIPIVIEIINSMIEYQILNDLSKIKSNNISWKQINKHPEIIKAIKLIASLKAQEYILRRLLSNNMNVLTNKQDYEEERILTKVEEIQYDNAVNNIQFDKKEDIKGVKWYERWREENL